MKKIRLWGLMVISLVLLNACATNQFSCNATAGDKCLDVEEVDAMSQDGTTLETLNNKNIPQASQVPSVNTTGGNVSRVWIAPYKDNQGQYHDATMVYLSDDEDESGE